MTTHRSVRRPSKMPLLAERAIRNKVHELIEKYSEQGDGHFDTAPGSPLHTELVAWLREQAKGGKQ